MIRTHPLPAAGARRTRPRASLALRAVLAAMLTIAASAAPAAAAPSCSAATGQSFIDDGRLDRAIREFTCVIEAQPTDIEGYRGRIEANLLLGRYAASVADYVRMAAVVVPVHPDAESTIFAGYDARLAVAPTDVAALTGASFARWWAFDYPQAIHVLERLLDVRPHDPFAILFRGSSRLLHGVNKPKGVEDLDHAIALAPTSPDVRFIVADAYTYGQPDPERALAEASRALEGGLDTARVHAILGAAYNALGETELAAAHIERHFELVTMDVVATAPLGPDATVALDLVPGRAYDIPLVVTAGETIAITTSSPDFWDSIALLHAPDGTPLVGSDDDSGYFAAFDLVAPETGTYRLLATSFESVSFGVLILQRD
jgi:tetratricopeptide (TPR) repeat protein